MGVTHEISIVLVEVGKRDGHYRWSMCADPHSVNDKVSSARVDPLPRPIKEAHLLHFPHKCSTVDGRV